MPYIRLKTPITNYGDLLPLGAILSVIEWTPEGRPIIECGNGGLLTLPAASYEDFNMDEITYFTPAGPDPAQKDASLGINLDLVVMWLFMPNPGDHVAPELHLHLSCWELLRGTAHIVINGQLATEIHAALLKRV